MCGKKLSQAAHKGGLCGFFLINELPVPEALVRTMGTGKDLIALFTWCGAP